jgi:hypothetical protein
MPIATQRTGARVLLLLLGCSGLTAAAAGPTSADDCVAIADREARLACYDAVHGHADEVAPAVPAPPAQPAPPADFGAEQLPQRPSEPDAEEELLVAIVEMGRQATGRHWFRLENGQLWSQVSPERTTLKAGDSVRISRGLLGTYHLREADGGSRSTAVRRLE